MSRLTLVFALTLIFIA